MWGLALKWNLEQNHAKPPLKPSLTNSVFPNLIFHIFGCVQGQPNQYLYDERIIKCLIWKSLTYQSFTGRESFESIWVSFSLCSFSYSPVHLLSVRFAKSLKLNSNCSFYRLIFPISCLSLTFNTTSLGMLLIQSFNFASW